MNNMQSSALSGIRILDLSRILAGPAAMQILGDLGAEVIKIEQPGKGDDTRKWGPPFLKDENGEDTSESAYYLSANRNKKSVAIDLTSPEGQELIHALLKKSDVMVHNFKVGGLEKYGLGYEQIKARHPHIIYCAISGFGQSGPMASEPGYDFVAQGLSGLMACTGKDGEEPMKVGVALGDVMSGLYAAIGVLAALNARQSTGRGQMVDISLLDCTLASLVNIAQYYLTSGTCAPRLGNAHSTIVPYQVFEAADGYLIIAVGNDAQFARFCDIAGQPEWASDIHFAKNENRVRNRDILVPLVADIIKQHSMSEWLEDLRTAGVPCAPVNSMDMTFDMEQIKAREMKIAMEHPLSTSQINLVGSPLKLSEDKVSYRHPPPVLGQHTDQVLSELIKDMDAQKLTALRKGGVIG